ncbi:MAG: ABC transporter ATP-binding protein [Erysipelotrichaceae bacterium]|nr:ABC transporter ATP-binding protein [Erysipelotrichaceae bacterium]
MIKVTNVRKTYTGFELNCSMELRKGTITGLIGRNGAGKSTLFKCILQLIYPESGEIKLLGKDIKDITEADRCRIGTVMSDSGISGYLTIEDAEKILKNFYPKFDGKAYQEMCRQAGLDPKKKIKDLSTGMKARHRVICALTHDPDLLILDEPTSGLDVIARNEILELLRNYMAENPDHAILVSSHISSDLENLCDDIYMIEDGKIILHEDADVLNDSYAILKVRDDEYRDMDKSHVLKVRKEMFGVICLTDDANYYRTRYPEMIVEKSGIDHLIEMMIGGENV